MNVTGTSSATSVLDQGWVPSKKTLYNCACVIAAIAAASLLASQTPFNAPNQILMASGTIVLGAVIRAFQQFNFSPETVRLINDFCSRWSLAQFEATWQVFENLDSTIGKEICLDLLAGQFGYQVANEFFNILEQRKGSRSYYLAGDRDLLNKEVVNKGTEVTVPQTKSSKVFFTACSVASLATTAFGFAMPYLPEVSAVPGVDVLVASAGGFASMLSLGLLGAQYALSYRQKKLVDRQEVTLASAEEDTLLNINEEVIPTSTEEFPKVSKKEWLWREVWNIGQLVGTELLVGTVFVAKIAYPRLLPFAFGAAGVGTAFIYILRRLKFSRLTPEDFIAQQENNTHLNSKGQRVLNTAGKIDTWLTGFLNVAIFSWFGYGISQSSWKAIIGISGLLSGITASELLTYLVERLFSPGQSNRAVNLLRVILIDNNYLLPLGYLFFTTFTGITDDALLLDDNLKLVFGVLGLFFFGTFFGNVSVRNLSKARPSPDYASTAFRFRSFARILQRFTGVLSPTTASI